MMGFGEIPVKKLTATVPKASAKRLERDRRLIIEGNYIHWNEPQQIVYQIPEGADEVTFDFKDESDPDSLPDEDGYISQDAPLDGRIRYRFYVEFHNQTSTRVERVEVQPRRSHECVRNQGSGQEGGQVSR